MAFVLNCDVKGIHFQYISRVNTVTTTAASGSSGQFDYFLLVRKDVRT
jgi:hypothetical protein